MENQPLFPGDFGELLKTHRKRQRLTQRHLAQQLGVHMNTVSSWELGTYLPATRGLVLELAQHLVLSERETRQLLEASLTALAPHWDAPLPRNPLFTGREEILEALHTSLSTKRVVALTQPYALQGLGGIGKTQVALEYAYRYALEYSAIFWIEAETSEHIVSSLLRMAEVLQLPARDDKDQQRVVAAVQHWLVTHSQWLLIWDNLEQMELLHLFLPPTQQGANVITTRCQALGALAREMDLEPMTQEEGILLLLRRAKVLELEATSEQVQQFAARRPGEYAAATGLVTAMAGLPLALDQAGAYIDETRCGLTGYLQRYEQQHPLLLSLRGGPGSAHPQSVTATFRLAMRRVEQEQPAAADMLRVCALLHAEAIPEEVFVAGARHLGPTLEPLATDPCQLDQAFAALRNLSLVRRHAETQTFSLHRLLQAVLLESMTEAEREHWNRLAIRALDAPFPEVLATTEYPIWKQCERLLLHALLCLRQDSGGVDALTLASLASKVALYLRVRGRYAEAEPLFQRALYMREQALGPDHPQVANALSNLATLYGRQGKYAQAEPLFQRALSIREQVLGPEHPDVAGMLNNLAILCHQQGKYAQAEPFYRRALQLCEQAQGPGSPQVASALNNLGLLYQEQGKYAQAEPLLQRALSIREQVLGSDHPQVASTLNNLGLLAMEQRRDTEAEPLLQRALSMREQIQGPEHPDVRNPLFNLAELFSHQGRYAEAEPLLQRALRISERSYGPAHPEVARSLGGLANLSREQGDDKAAEALYQRTLSLQEQSLGHEHPKMAQTIHDLAIFRQKQGQLDEALSLAQRALSIRSQSLGDGHPHTLTTQELAMRLVREHACVGTEAASERRLEAIPDPEGKEDDSGRASSSPHKAGTAAPGENDPLQEFFDACCELSPRAWCRSADLWRAYICWIQERQERFPLSRRAFAAQLAAHGCHADRTNTARIWHGIVLCSSSS